MIAWRYARSMMMLERQSGKTVFAVASGKGIAGVCVVRISGPRCEYILQALCGKIPPPRLASLMKLRRRIGKDIIDHGLVIWFPAPASFTGEDVAEFHIHGGPAVISLLLRELAEFDGVEAAKPGIFTRRAFLNGKMDLTRIEGLADLLHAETEFQRRQALKQFSGIAGKQFQKWRQQLKEIMAYYEALIDFTDEDLDENLLEVVKGKIEKLKDEMSSYLDAAKYGERLRNGYRVVLAGEVNVGKSTLLNSLAKRDVAIVSDQPGTTRDVIELYLDLEGMPVIVSDTAGIRDTGGEIEIEGIRRAHDRICEAELVLWISDRVTSGTIMELQGLKLDGKLVRVLNKVDLIKPDIEWDGIKISARDGTGIDSLLKRITKEAQSAMSGAVDAVVVRQRHVAAIRDCLESLDRNEQMDDVQIDIIAENIREAMGKLGDVVGRVGVEEVLDSIFSDFCIGK